MTLHADQLHRTDAAPGAKREALRVLETLKRDAITELGGVLSGFWSAIEEQVRLASLAATHDYAAAQEDRVAVMALSQRALELATRFRKSLEDEFARWELFSEPSGDERSLSLMSEGELESHLAGQQIIELLDHQFVHPLTQLDERLALLATALGIQRMQLNPLRPEVPVAAFVALFAPDDLTSSLRELVFHQFDKRLPKALGDVYNKSNATLDAASFGTEYRQRQVLGGRPAVQRSPASHAPQAVESWVPDGGVVPSIHGAAGAGPANGGSVGAGGAVHAQGGAADGGYASGDIGGFGRDPGAHGHRDMSARDPSALVHGQDWSMEGDAGEAPSTAQIRAQVVAQSLASRHRLRHRELVHPQLRAWRARQQGNGGVALAHPDAAGHRDRAPVSSALPHADPREHSRDSDNSGVGSARVLATSDLLDVASLLQRHDGTAYARVLGGEAQGPLADVIRHEILSGVHRIGFDPARTRFSIDEEDAIDLVGILFESLFQANDLVEPARDIYGRLVVPYLKVALTDDSMFNRRSHPARRLLDALTEALDGNVGETPQDRETMDRAGQVVDRVVEEYRDDQAIFELSAAELRDHLDQQRRRSELAEKRVAEALHGRERLQQARTHADGLVASQLADRPLTVAVAHFLDKQWRHHLIQTWLRDGADSARHLAAIEMGRAMVQVDADAAQVLGDAVARQLLALQGPLADCYSSCGLDAGAARDALARIISALAMPDTARTVHLAQSSAAGTADDEPVESGLRLVGGRDTVHFDPAIAARMRRLRVGQGLRLLDDDGRESAARIAWISPMTSRFLIVNRRGARRMVVSPEELAALVGSGRVLLRAVDAPFDEAMKQLWQHINPPVVPASRAS